MGRKGPSKSQSCCFRPCFGNAVGGQPVTCGVTDAGALRHFLALRANATEQQNGIHLQTVPLPEREFLHRLWHICWYYAQAVARGIGTTVWCHVLLLQFHPRGWGFDCLVTADPNNSL